MKMALNYRIQAGDIQSPNGSSNSSTVRGWICADALLAVSTLEKKEVRLLHDKSSAILLFLLVTYVATRLKWKYMYASTKNKHLRRCII